jgi:hypothetical protein
VAARKIAQQIKLEKCDRHVNSVVSYDSQACFAIQFMLMFACLCCLADKGLIKVNKTVKLRIQMERLWA